MNIQKILGMLVVLSTLVFASTASYAEFQKQFGDDRPSRNANQDDNTISSPSYRRGWSVDCNDSQIASALTKIKQCCTASGCLGVETSAADGCAFVCDCTTNSVGSEADADKAVKTCNEAPGTTTTHTGEDFDASNQSH